MTALRKCQLSMVIEHGLDALEALGYDQTLFIEPARTQLDGAIRSQQQMTELLSHMAVLLGHYIATEAEDHVVEPGDVVFAVNYAITAALLGQNVQQTHDAIDAMFVNGTLAGVVVSDDAAADDELNALLTDAELNGLFTDDDDAELNWLLTGLQPVDVGITAEQTTTTPDADTLRDEYTRRSSIVEFLSSTMDELNSIPRLRNDAQEAALMALSDALVEAKDALGGYDYPATESGE